MQPQQPLLPRHTSVASASAAAASAASAADAAPASASKQTNAPSSLSSNTADPTDPSANLQTLHSSAATRASREKPCPANEKITRRPSLSNRTPRHPHPSATPASSLHSKATLQSRHGACARRPATCSTHTLAARAPAAPPARDYTAYRQRRGEGGAVNVTKAENNNNLLCVGARVETSVVTASVHGRGGKRGGDRDVECVDREGVVLRVMGDRCLIRWDRLPPSQSVTTPVSMSSRHASDTTSSKTSSKRNNKAKGSTNSTSSNKSTAPIWGVKGVGLLQERECVLLMRLGALRPVVNMVQREGDGNSGRRGCVATGGKTLSLSVLMPL